jgi:hypothetical protein
MWNQVLRDWVQVTACRAGCSSKKLVL